MDTNETPQEQPQAEPAAAAPSADDLNAQVEKWKALARKHEAASKANADKAKRFDDLEAANMSEAEKVQAELAGWQKKAQEASERELAAVRRALSAEVATHAKDKFADADLAIKLLGDVADYGNSENGVDADKLTAAFDGLLEKYPYLARGGETVPRMKPNPAQANPGAPAITIDQQIEAAAKAGDFARSIALKQAKAYQTGRR